MSAEPVGSTPRWVRWWVAAVTLSAFGPYLTPGVRTEQIAVYGSGLLVLLGMWVHLRHRANSGPAPFLFLWGAFAAIAITGAVFPEHNLTRYPPGSALAGVDNALAPLALIATTWVWASLSPDFTLVRTAAKIVTAAMTLNGVLAIRTVSGGLGAFPWLSMFWGSDTGSVAVRAAGNGRFSGIFNQPVEAGIAYSLAAFCLLYLVATSAKYRTFVVAGVGAVLTIGGLLTTSKVFLFGGLPIMVYLVLRDRRRRGRLFMLGLVAVGLLAFFELIGVEFRLPQWDGARMFTDLIDAASVSLLWAVTAGRLGEDGTLAYVASEILAHHALFGLGAGGLAVPYDSTWLEALTVAGVAGVALVGLLHLLLVRRWWRLRDVLPAAEARLAGAVVLLAAGASFGMPALTGNRVSTLLWVFLGLLVTTRVAARQTTVPVASTQAVPRHQIGLPSVTSK